MRASVISYMVYTGYVTVFMLLYEFYNDYIADWHLYLP